jgi:hypothetical protein
MKKTRATIAIAAGLGLGGLAVGTAVSAQTYGPDDQSIDVEAPTTEPASTVIVDDTSAPVATSEPISQALQADNGDGEGRCAGRGLGTAAELIGIESSALRAALDEGQSIADVATENDVDPDAVVAAMLAERTERLEARVADGRLTQAEADERLAEKSERITERVFGTES